MSHFVELPPVQVDQGSLAGTNCGQRRIHPCLKGMRSQEGATSQCCSGQPGAVEESRSDARDGHTVRGGPLKDGPARLPQARIRPVVPRQLVEQAVLAGHEHLVPDESVGTWRQTRAERPHARRGCRRKA